MNRSNLACPLFLILVAGLSSHSAETPTGIADGYKLLFEQKFDAESSLKDFVFTDFKAWKWSKEENSGALELAQQSQYTPAVRSPVNIALIADKVFTDFILEADLIQTGKEYGRVRVRHARGSWSQCSRKCESRRSTQLSARGMPARNAHLSLRLSPGRGGPTTRDTVGARTGWPRHRRSLSPGWDPRPRCGQVAMKDWPECTRSWRCSLVRCRRLAGRDWRCT